MSGSRVGHPGFDLLGLVDGLANGERDVLAETWANGWRQQAPGCDPIRALELLRPVNALRSAAVYAEFVANIEPTEHSYHWFDVPEMLDVAIRLHRSAPSSWRPADHL